MPKLGGRKVEKQPGIAAWKVLPLVEKPKGGKDAVFAVCAMGTASCLPAKRFPDSALMVQLNKRLSDLSLSSGSLA